MKLPLLFLGLPHGMEWIFLAILGLLLFGRRLPGIARSLGSSVVEFKKGIQGVKDDIDEQASKPAPKVEEKDDRRIEANASERDGKRVIDVESKATTSAGE